jgi:hypothetical protein
MLISIVCPDMSTNALGRAYWLARVAQRVGYDVEVIGPRFGSGIWVPLAGRSHVPMVGVPTPRTYPGFLRCLRWLVSLIRGELIWAVKPLTSSFLPSLLASRFPRRPLILDIDDWELGLFRGSPLRPFGLRLATDMVRRPNSVASTWLWEHLTG